jgi:DMSO/TMAO reductase YedYZ heme-binding membrane subunit
MEVILCLVATSIAVWLLRKPIAKAPWAFYIAAAALSLAFGTGLVSNLSYQAAMLLTPVMRRCELAFALLAVVMFIGVLPKDLKLRLQLVPIRGYLAIIAAILASCHIFLYGRAYLAKVGVAFGGLNTATYAALAFAVALAVLLAVLSVTSVRMVRHRMSPQSWRTLQKASYVFFPLIGVHALLMIGPAALAGGPSAGNALAYLVVIVAYIAARLARAAADRRGVCDDAR